MSNYKLQITNKIQNPKLEAGFTLIEMLIAIAIFVIISVGLVALVSSVFVSSSKQSNLLADSDQARKLAFNIINELRNATVSSTGAYVLATADNQTLTFYSNIDLDAGVERVRYFAQNGKLYKGVLKPVGDPLTYNPANEKTFVVQNNLANGINPLFYYYDGAYDGVNGSALSQPVNVTAVKFIKLDLKVYNTGGVTNTNFYTVTASGSIRNLKENLGDAGLPDYFYQLITEVSPSGAGSVAVSPEGPDYPEGSLANLAAYWNLGYVFSSWSGGVTSPTSSSTSIVMNDNKTVTANFSAVSPTLTGSITNKTGNQNARKWTLRINNPNAYSVGNTNLYSFGLTQTAGAACSPALASPLTFPALVGNIQAGGGRNYVVTIDFSGCSSQTRFTASFSFAGNNGADWGNASIVNQAQ